MKSSSERARRPSLPGALSCRRARFSGRSAYYFIESHNLFTEIIDIHIVVILTITFLLIIMDSSSGNFMDSRERLPVARRLGRTDGCPTDNLAVNLNRRLLFSRPDSGREISMRPDRRFLVCPGVNYVSDFITDWGGNVWQFTVSVDTDSLYTKLHCTCDIVYVDPYLPPNYAFPSEFELTLFM